MFKFFSSIIYNMYRCNLNAQKKIIFFKHDVPPWKALKAWRVLGWKYRTELTSKKWEELGDMSAPIVVSVAALLWDLWGNSRSLSTLDKDDCSFIAVKSSWTWNINENL